MSTLRFLVNAENLASEENRRALDAAAAILRGGGTVAIPTETVYGLGANALDATAVAKIFAAKERPGWDPLIVHVADEAMLGRVVAEVPATARKLIDAFWPGPLTLLLPRTAAVPDAVTAGRALVGVRMPAHPVALELIRRAGVPVAAPSANRFGHVSPTTAGHVLADLMGRIDAVIDSGPTQVGVESTVLDLSASPMIVYRAGAVTLEQIRAVAGAVEKHVEQAGLADEPRDALPSPGVGLRHYAPRARLVLVELQGCDEWGRACAEQLLVRADDFAEQRVGILMPDSEGLGPYRPGRELFPWGDWENPELLAQRLFMGLRTLDGVHCSVILCPVPAGEGIAEAIRDRLYKAARPE